MNKICLALIHNHDRERYESIKTELQGLKEWLSNKRFEVQLIEIAYQPAIIPHSRSMAFLRDSIYHVIGFNWATYRFLKPSFLFYVATFLRKVCKSGRYAAGGAWRRSSAIEVAVTDKHIRAWAAFLDIDSDYLVVFEDDAVFTIDSKQLLSDLLEQLSQGQSGRNIYVDLAGGCPLDSLKIDLLQSDQDRSFRHYQKPVTNTACGYLMSNSLVVQFHKVLTRKPWLRLIGVDWMMNALFVNLERDGADCACMHAEPTFFKHGSTTGEYVPWAR